MTDAGTDAGVVGGELTRPGRFKTHLLRAVLKPSKFALAVIFAMTPVTAIIVLGWLARLSERKTLNYFFHKLNTAHGDMSDPDAVARRNASNWPNWFLRDDTFDHISLLGQADSSQHSATQPNIFSRALGGLGANISAGLKTVIGLAILTSPWGALWLLGWWSGWQNSFTKGYEQAFAGPVISLIGIAMALVSLSYLPMALAHFSIERRISAFFEIRKVTKLIHAAGWRYLALSVGYVIACLPIFLATVAPVFIEQIKPEILEMTPAEISELAGGFRFWTTIYIAAALIVLRTMAARLYARSLLRLPGRERTYFEGTRLLGCATNWGCGKLTTSKPRFGKIRAVLMTILLPIIWFGLVAQTYIGQFMNYKWWSWLSHPLIQIPWFPPLGPWG